MASVAVSPAREFFATAVPRRRRVALFLLTQFNPGVKSALSGWKCLSSAGSLSPQGSFKKDKKTCFIRKLFNFSEAVCTSPLATFLLFLQALEQQRIKSILRRLNVSQCPLPKSLGLAQRGPKNVGMRAQIHFFSFRARSNEGIEEEKMGRKRRLPKLKCRTKREA